MNDYLYHHGIKGMKWGVRHGPPYPLTGSSKKQAHGTEKKSSSDASNNSWGVSKSRLSMKTKSGDRISLQEHPSGAMSKFLSKVSKNIAREQKKTANFDIKDPSGKTVGDVQLYKESKDSMNVTWLTTNSDVRGRGYGSAVMKSAIQIARDQGMKTVTLEVPGNSPDARHIYEKLGFKEVASPNRDESDIWGGLTNMRLDLDDVKHSDLESDGFSEEILRRFIEGITKEIDMDENQNTLAHYGVKGMKWGVRKERERTGLRDRKGSSKKETHQKAAGQKKNGLSDKQKKALKVAGGVALTTAALAAVGHYNFKSGKVTALNNSLGKFLDKHGQWTDAAWDDNSVSVKFFKDNIRIGGDLYWKRDSTGSLSIPYIQNFKIWKG